jgi:hypothetical protein
LQNLAGFFSRKKKPARLMNRIEVSLRIVGIARRLRNALWMVG